MKHLTKVEKDEIKRRAQNGEAQIDIAKDIASRGFVTATGKPFMFYTVSDIVNEKRRKARNKRYWTKIRSARADGTLPPRGKPRGAYARKVKSTESMAAKSPDMQLFVEILTNSWLTDKKKVKTLIGLLEE